MDEGSNELNGSVVDDVDNDLVEDFLLGDASGEEVPLGSSPLLDNGFRYGKYYGDEDKMNENNFLGKDIAIPGGFDLENENAKHAHIRGDKDEEDEQSFVIALDEPITVAKKSKKKAGRIERLPSFSRIGNGDEFESVADEDEDNLTDNEAGDEVTDLRSRSESVQTRGIMSESSSIGFWSKKPASERQPTEAISSNFVQAQHKRDKEHRKKQRKKLSRLKQKETEDDVWGLPLFVNSWFCYILWSYLQEFIRLTYFFSYHKRGIAWESCFFPIFLFVPAIFIAIPRIRRLTADLSFVFHLVASCVIFSFYVSNPHLRIVLLGCGLSAELSALYSNVYSHRRDSYAASLLLGLVLENILRVSAASLNPLCICSILFSCLAFGCCLLVLLVSIVHRHRMRKHKLAELEIHEYLIGPDGESKTRGDSPTFSPLSRDFPGESRSSNIFLPDSELPWETDLIPGAFAPVRRGVSRELQTRSDSNRYSDIEDSNEQQQEIDNQNDSEGDIGGGRQETVLSVDGIDISSSDLLPTLASQQQQHLSDESVPLLVSTPVPHRGGLKSSSSTSSISSLKNNLKKNAYHSAAEKSKKNNYFSSPSVSGSDLYSSESDLEEWLALAGPESLLEEMRMERGFEPGGISRKKKRLVALSHGTGGFDIESSDGEGERTKKKKNGKKQLPRRILLGLSRGVFNIIVTFLWYILDLDRTKEGITLFSPIVGTPYSSSSAGNSSTDMSIFIKQQQRHLSSPSKAISRHNWHVLFILVFNRIFDVIFPSLAMGSILFLLIWLFSSVSITCRWSSVNVLYGGPILLTTMIFGISMSHSRLMRRNVLVYLTVPLPAMVIVFFADGLLAFTALCVLAFYFTSFVSKVIQRVSLAPAFCTLISSQVILFGMIVASVSVKAYSYVPGGYIMRYRGSTVLFCISMLFIGLGGYSVGDFYATGKAIFNLGSDVFQMIFGGKGRRKERSSKNSSSSDKHKRRSSSRNHSSHKHHLPSSSTSKSSTAKDRIILDMSNSLSLDGSAVDSEDLHSESMLVPFVDDGDDDQDEEGSGDNIEVLERTIGGGGGDLNEGEEADGDGEGELEGGIAVDDIESGVGAGAGAVSSLRNRGWKNGKKKSAKRRSSSSSSKTSNSSMFLPSRPSKRLFVACVLTFLLLLPAIVFRFTYFTFVQETITMHDNFNVLSLNVQESFRDDGTNNLEDVVKLLVEHRVDVVSLQESQYLDLLLGNNDLVEYLQSKLDVQDESSTILRGYWGVSIISSISRFRDEETKEIVSDSPGGENGLVKWVHTKFRYMVIDLFDAYISPTDDTNSEKEAKDLSNFVTSKEAYVRENGLVLLMGSMAVEPGSEGYDSLTNDIGLTDACFATSNETNTITKDYMFYKRPANEMVDVEGCWFPTNDWKSTKHLPVLVTFLVGEIEPHSSSEQ